jgi:hypothetical protein
MTRSTNRKYSSFGVAGLLFSQNGMLAVVSPSSTAQSSPPKDTQGIMMCTTVKPCAARRLK